MTISTGSRRGRPKWYAREIEGVNWERDGHLALLICRCRAIVAAGFSEGFWERGPCVWDSWDPVAIAIKRAQSLMLQARSTVNKGSAEVVSPPLEVTVECRTSRSESAELWRRPFNNFPTGSAGAAIRVQVEVERGVECRDGRRLVVLVQLRYPETAVGEPFEDFIKAELEFQLGLALDRVRLRPRTGFGIEPPLGQSEVLWDVRVRFSDFLVRFLERFRRSGWEVIHPFVSFMLVPRTCHEGRRGSDIRSGFFGYRYHVDEGQREYLEELKVGDPELRVEALAEEWVPYPEGLCGEVFLGGRAVGPRDTGNLIRSYEQDKPWLAATEKAILKDGMLIEIPIFETGLCSMEGSPDGPEVVLCVSVPSDLGVPGDRVAAKESLAEGLATSPLKPGETGVVQEMAQRLVGKYVRLGVAAPRYGIVGESRAMRRVYERIASAAGKDSDVLIEGETGTGKELVVNAIHGSSARRERPLIDINCGAFPQELIESELFGIEAGIATGVGFRKGVFEQANGGTIFLDQINDLPAIQQVKLLRVLQERKFRRVGGDEAISVDVRIIAASTKPLMVEVDHGRFREDLYYRLRILWLPLPPLRDREGDLVLLVNHFLALERRKSGMAAFIDEDGMQLLASHPWRGNVRELENLIAAVAGGNEGVISANEIAEWLRGGRDGHAT